MKKGQIGVEYMIIVGFVTLAIATVLVLAVYYSDQLEDRIRLNQVENFATQLVNSAESVFFSGEPSKTTVRLYLPDGVQGIGINSDDIIINVAVSSGQNIRAYHSRVPLQGSITPTQGTKKITLQATEDHVQIS